MMLVDHFKDNSKMNDVLCEYGLARGLSGMFRRYNTIFYLYEYLRVSKMFLSFWFMD